LLIEDAAEALGTTITVADHTAFAGCWGDIGCFSFNGNKTITTGGGGMVVSANKALMTNIRHLSLQARSQGQPQEANQTFGLLAVNDIAHDAVGYNARMTGMPAAMGIAQLTQLDGFLKRKHQFAMVYAQQLQAVAGANVGLLTNPKNQGASWWLSPLLLQTPALRNGLISYCLANGIECRPFFKPINTLLPYQHVKANCPQSNHLWQHGVCLPSSTQMTHSQQDEVIATVKHYLQTTTG
jgi:perosamine synthetase